MVPWFFLTPILWSFATVHLDGHHKLEDLLRWGNFVSPPIYAVRAALWSGHAPRVADVVYLAVAAVVASGWADAGLCVKPAAAEAGLRFVSLHQEAYELCVAEKLLDDPRVSALVATLQSQAYRQQIGDMPGCVAHETGSVRRVA